MRRYLRINKLLIIFLSCSFASPILAFDFAAWLQGFGSWERDLNKKVRSGAGDTFYISRWNLALPLEVYHTEHSTYRIGFIYEETDLEWTGTSVNSDTFHWLGLPVTYLNTHDQQMEISLKITPGLSPEIDTFYKAFTLDAEATVLRYLQPNAYLQVGAMVNRNMGDTKLHPVVAYSWLSQSDLEVKVGYPYSHVRMPWGKSFSTHLTLQPAGGIWKNEMYMQDHKHLDIIRVEYRNWRAAVGAKYEILGIASVAAEVGQKWDRSIRAVDDYGVTLQGRPASTFYWQINLSLGID